MLIVAVLLGLVVQLDMHFDHDGVSGGGQHAQSAGEEEEESVVSVSNAYVTIQKRL